MRTLDEIAEEIRSHKDDMCGFETCEQCTNFVPGEGNPDAEILFIGEAPGKNEDLLGRPFVGAAGKLLDHLIESIGLTRGDVFITNVLKSRPPDNRDPLPGEAEHNWPWLEEQMAVIDPKLTVLLGRHAMNRFLPNRRISRDHGQARLSHGHVYLPVHHPAAALYTRALEQTLMIDFAKIPELLDRIRATPREELIARSSLNPDQMEIDPDAGPATAGRAPSPTFDDDRLVAGGETPMPAPDQHGLF